MLAGAEEFPPRLYGTDDEVRRVASGLLARTLPRPEWTHEAHLCAVSVLVIEHDLPLETALPGIISAYNVSVGGVNDSTQGYHETLTQYWIASARAFHSGGEGPICARVNAFIASPAGRRDAPLRHFSHELLFSVEARLGRVEPDLMRFEWSQ